ncbi:MAG: NB-ARC domain-containing protein [Endozoicomonas sp.]|uniref:NB-ARC domain-containing protein n=1 Tax=Endozoicomonas sp. TaxID=1892382 RepID=UPI003D9B240A
MQKFIDMLQKKADVAKSESDFAYFMNLLVFGEAIVKLIVLSTTSVLSTNDKDRHQYRILSSLVRANGLGDWSKAVDELLVGTASQILPFEFRSYQAEIAKKVGAQEWQYQAVENLISACNIFEINTTSNKGNKAFKDWFKLFSELRNKTRGHGAMPLEEAALAAPLLAKSIQIAIDNLSLLKIPTAYLKRNLSGKYRVTEIYDCDNVFDYLKKSENYTFSDGVYIYLDSKCWKIPLLLSDPGLSDFYISNGSFTIKKYELLSYCTDDKQKGDSAEFLKPLGQLPKSESEGVGELEPKGNCFSNVPDLSYEYISRNELEGDLLKLLLDDRRTVVTLLGRGGIGKTSLALRVIPDLYQEERFDAIVWFSSRDIDLHASGAKIVRADVITKDDISKRYCELVLSENEIREKDFKCLDYFQSQLTESDIGSSLFVFDNFETTDSPIEIFNWIDTYIRNPNKVLITTRLRDFIGDYPVNVHGMTFDESKELVLVTARSLGLECIITDSMIEEIYHVSSGHPYVIKVMLGNLSRDERGRSLPKLIAGKDEVLTALFERTYSALTPCAQQVFLTLSSWNSAVPRLALEAVLMTSIDKPLEVEKAIDSLTQYSMIEELKSENDGQYYVGLPFVALAFGKKKASVSPLRNKIQSDVKILQMFGVSKLDDQNLYFSNNFSRYLKNIDFNAKSFFQNKEIIDGITLSYNGARLALSAWLMESDNVALLKEAKKYLELFLENETEDANKMEAWRSLANLSKQLGEPLEEIHSLVELSQFSDVDYSVLSNVANKMNRMLNNEELTIDSHGAKRELVTRLYGVMHTRKNEADAVDHSRAAWLALHLGKEDEAKALTTNGLQIDPFNKYCLKLKEKFK